MTVKNETILTRNSQIQHKAQRKSFYAFPALFCLLLMQASIEWVLIVFGIQVIKTKRSVRSVFPGYHSVFYDYVII